MDKNGKKEALGLDVGGVIINRLGDQKDVFLSGDYLSVKAIEGAFDAIRKIVSNRFEERVFLVSRIKEARNEGKTRDWLSHHNFWKTTEISSKNIYFCKERAEKVDICKNLGITHFVDDRLEVLHGIFGVVENLYLFDLGAKYNDDFIKKIDPDYYKELERKINKAKSWEDILNKLIPTKSAVLQNEKSIWHM